MFLRLLWQEYRQARMTVVGLTLAAIAISGLIAVSPVGDSTVPIGAVLVVILSGIFGVSVFQSETAGGTWPYLAHRGVAAWRVWLAKELVWAAATILAGGVILASVSALNAARSWSGARTYPGDRLSGELGVFLTVLAVNCFAAGQWTSVLCRRGIVAAMLTVPTFIWIFFVPAVVCGITNLLPAADQRSVFLPALSVAPVLLLLLSLWRADDWLLQRTSWRARLRLAVILTTPTLDVVLAFFAWRAYEVPDIGDPFPAADVLAQNVPDEENAAPLYRQAIALITPDPFEQPPTRPPTVSRGAPSWQPYQDYLAIIHTGWSAATPPWKHWVEKNSVALDLLAEAAAKERCIFSPPLGANPNTIAFPGALGPMRLLVLDARRLEAAGDLHAALERYQCALRMGEHFGDFASPSVYFWTLALQSETLKVLDLWVSHPAQKPALVTAALARLEQAGDGRVALIRALMLGYLQDENQRQLRVLTTFFGHDMGSDQWLLDRWTTSPWEVERDKRARKLLTAAALAAASKEPFERSILQSSTGANKRARRRWAGWADWLDSLGSFQKGQGSVARFFSVETLDYFTGTTPSLRWPNTPNLGSIPWFDRELARRRATLLKLALQAWKLQHGKWPENLGELVPTYFKELPVDPFSGETFRYRFSTGETLPIEGYDYAIALGQPILYSVGPDGIDDGGRHDWKNPYSDQSTDLLFPVPPR